ncbi:IS630 family transposase [Oscillatoria sp. FACHB-1406]|uniref:IS630 family transposase n=1 Tax=Oscillatoria sp. FACHB-1406 TaxID=2692846 RepID=UPI001688859C|nr:IS630 family transposase [Oscillatoria sp. FACHB-1406]MBD2578807.1 IS630 family transposase [Oscillatoria sp. FACHB-1406]
MRFFRELEVETLKLLKRIDRDSKSSQVRQRAKCIILSYQGYSIRELMAIFKVSRKTLYNWLTRWEDQRILGLYNQKGRGRKSKLSLEQKEQVKEWVKQDPKNLKGTILKIENEWEIKVSKDTVKRTIKKWKMKWKRMKRGMSKSPAEWELEVKLPLLKELKDKNEKGEIDLRYFDESGFSLKPLVPYGWQESGERISLRSCSSKRLNVLGLMNRENELFYEICPDKVETDTLIKFFDRFSQKLLKPTTIALDQASIHTSDKFLRKLPEWKAKNLSFFWLPTYSPKQNLIEILWKFIKYEWIEVSAYESWNSLLNYLEKVLSNLGREYVINFA